MQDTKTHRVGGSFDYVRELGLTTRQREGGLCGGPMLEAMSAPEHGTTARASTSSDTAGKVCINEGLDLLG